MASVLHEGSADDAQTRRRSLEKYRRHAARYDGTCGPTWRIRKCAITALNLQPGERVLDVACGTGLSLALLREQVGERGHVFGFDHSAEMLAHARERVVRAGWRNVTLVESAAQEVALPQPVDALLFHYTHDILRSTAALDRVLACAKPGARVAIAGVKYFPWWLAPLNAWVYLKNHAYNGAPGELRTPWDRIAPHLADWRWQPTQFGMGYIASGRLIPAGRDGGRSIPQAAAEELHVSTALGEEAAALSLPASVPHVPAARRADATAKNA
ncbi:MAG: methyltransferase domain-containing protein [Burkholderiaceae bacterium]|jgi:ubiquinone/menaquinone biosynthesis C-methylase UbiE|nr:methyltransferase domain-containing protein [Burkholderiaceae bacterium]